MKKQNPTNKTGRLFEQYNKELVPVLKQEFKIDNIMAVPALKRINLNVGIGDVLKSKDVKEKLANDLSLIAGQKFSERKAKISVSAFAVREGMIVGLSATLRGKRMYDFFDKFVNIVLPRLRDFRGVKRTSFDKEGNYTLGLIDHTVFPEVDITKSAPAHGMEITFVTKAGSVEKGMKLLELMGMPFVK